MERTNEAVLRVLERDVLHPDVISKVVDKALDKFKASEIECKERRHSLYKQIKDVDVEIERLVAAISAGGDIPVLVTAVKAANERRSALSSDLAEADSQHRSDADYDQLKKDLKDTLRRHGKRFSAAKWALPARSSASSSKATVLPLPQ